MFLNKYYVLISWFLLIVFPAVSWADSEKVWSLKRAFSAELIEYNRHQPALQKKALIEIGQEGMRVVGLNVNTNKPEFMTIKNFRSKQEWFVRPDRLYYTEWMGKNISENAVESKLGLSVGLLNFKPCLGMKKQKLRFFAFKEENLIVWSCSGKGGKKFIQHYSTLLGMVVRQEDREGRIFELRNIMLDPPAKRGRFKPSDLWREVSLEAFFMGVPVLPDYQE